MTEERDTEPGDPSWLGKDYPVKTPAELALENAKPREVVRSFADRWGKYWIVVPIMLAAVAGLYRLLFH